MIYIGQVISHKKVIQTNYVILREHFTHFHVYIFHTKESGGGGGVFRLNDILYTQNFFCIKASFCIYCTLF